MEQSEVEKMEKAYQRSMVILAILGSIFLVIFGVDTLLLADGTFPGKMPRLYKVVRWGICGFQPIFLLIVFYVVYITRQLRRNKEVRKAWGNEMQRDITNKSMKVGFQAYMFLLIAAGWVASMFPVYAGALIWIVFLAGVLAMCIAWLYFNRQLE